MDKSWINFPRSSAEYGLGVSNFVNFAVTNSVRNKKILCPCKLCGNRFWLSQNKVHEHLICTGFMNGYSTWIFHGENPLTNSTETDSDESAHENADSDSDSVEFADTDEMGQMLMDGFGMYNNASLGEDEAAEEKEHAEFKRKREEENEHAEFKRLFTWKNQESETQQTYKEELPSSQVPINAVKSGQLGKRKEVPKQNKQDSQVKSQKKEELIKVKLEKVTENKAARAKQGKAEGKKKTENRGGTIILKKGMEVGLTSPNSAQIVGYGTLQNVDKDAKCTDGKPLCDYVEVLVNIVLKETTILPRALGRINQFGECYSALHPMAKKKSGGFRSRIYAINS